MLGGTLVYQNLDNALHPTRGKVASSTLEVAGLGGNKHFVRLRANASEYWPIGHGFIFSIRGEGGIIKSFGKNGSSSNEVLLTDRFFLGQPELRGFDYRGIGPRVIRRFYSTDANGNQVLPSLNDKNNTDDSLGGEGYYLAKFELEIPLGSGAHEMGLRPSIFMDVGSVFGIKTPVTSVFPFGTFIASRNSSGQALFTQVDTATTNTDGTCTITAASTVTTALNPHPPACLTTNANTPQGQSLPAFREDFFGNSPMPRLSIGAGVNWNSPFGPLRIDFAYPLLKQKGDQTKLFSFNVGTQF